MIKAAIDIGTNTVLLLVVQQKSGSEFDVLEELQRMPRLGRDVDSQKNLSGEAMSRVGAIIREYYHFLQLHYPECDNPIITATSAVRDAANRRLFIEKVKQETGLEVHILNGGEEAGYTFLGAQSVLDHTFEEEPVVVLDIGGGSTEIAWGQREEIIDRHSFDMGCVRFTERFLTTDPPTPLQMDTARQAILKMLLERPFDFDNHPRLIGVAGTVTSLAFIDQELSIYESGRLNGYSLCLSVIRDYISNFSSIPTDDLAARYPAVLEGRADIFLAGLLILEGVMEHYDFQSVTVSTGGIRHGAIVYDS
ncbi:Ppx/GppA phosphatase [Fodinibius sediminis]|uniref:Ppx/GppA phosphatase n=2 Tax=Fodinibius sediminis TaxID=1214077 RepID=A0A521DA99_9BACT|nr:Ppx/GppA phosphatase [Fodinibius sediminis]